MTDVDVDCPHCGKPLTFSGDEKERETVVCNNCKKKSVVMLCGKCGKFFAYKKRRDNPLEDGEPGSCPHCGYNNDTDDDDGEDSDGDYDEEYDTRTGFSDV
jgi:DNA-directed RNA polymerase subunit RPC12/RpoP